MKTSALIMMLSTLTIVTLATVYFFVRMINTPPKPEPDSFSENDDVKR